MNLIRQQLSPIEVAENVPMRRVTASPMLDAFHMGEVPDHLFRLIEQGPNIRIPDNFVDRRPRPAVIPSLFVESPCGNEAILSDLVFTNIGFRTLYEAACAYRAGAVRRVEAMTFEALHKVLDSPGNRGLHHIHGTRFPGVIFHNVRNTRRGRSGGSEGLGVYVTKIGELGSRQVLARVTATASKKDEYALFRQVGAGSQKAKYNP